VEIIRSTDRGYNDHGWLKTYHTFSFAEYYNRERTQFGALRVLNDDIVEVKNGFGIHPHQNMEIISIPLSGSLEHKDSTGIHGIITQDEVQVMSAGTGVNHSEMNPGDIAVNFLQLWIVPDKMNVEPRYDQKAFDKKGSLYKLQLLVSPDGRENSLWIYQQAFISRVQMNQGNKYEYKRFYEDHGVLIFLLKGRIQIGSETIHERDTILADTNDKVRITSSSTGTEILFVEVPMLTE